MCVCVCLTRVVVEDDVEQVLVSPGDVQFVFLQQRLQKLLPAEAG